MPRHATDRLTVEGLAIAVLLPLALFVALVVFWRLPPAGGVKVYLPERPPSPCGPVSIEPEALCDPERARTVGTSYFLCSPRSTRDADWTLTVDLLTHDEEGRCRYGLLAFDSPSAGSWNEDRLRRRAKSGRAYSGLRRAEDGTYRLDGAPSRTYLVVATWDDGESRGLSGPALQLGVQRTTGLNLRNSRIGIFGALLAGCASAAYVLFRWRPGGPRVPVTLFRERWIAVAALGALGAGLSGIAVDLLPADFGGYDAFAWRNFSLVPLFSACGALVALGLDVGRRSYFRLSPQGRTGVLLTTIALSAFLLAILQAVASGKRGPEEAFRYFHFSHFYMIYFATSLILPLVVVTFPSWRRDEILETRALPPSRDRALVLLGFALLSASVAGIITVCAGWLLRIPNPGHFFEGLVKPPMAIALPVVAIPVVTAFALAITLGESRPAWVQELEDRAERALRTGDPLLRARDARAVLGVLLRRLPFRESDRKHLGRVAWAVRGRLDQVLEGQRDQLRSESGLSEAEFSERSRALDAALAEIVVDATRFVEVRVPFVADGSEPAWWALRVECLWSPVLSPSERAYEVFVAGQETAPDSERDHVPGSHPLKEGERHVTLRTSVQVVADEVLDRLVGEDEHDRRALARHVIRVTFTPPPTSALREFRGRSYELPLALLLFQLGRRCEPVVPGWTATGVVDPAFGNVAAVEGFAVKLAAVRKNGAKVFLCPVGNLTPLGEDVHVARLEERSGVKQVLSLLRASGGKSPLVVGVKNLRLAVELVFGIRPPD
jgi:hypothetical protein